MPSVLPSSTPSTFTELPAHLDQTLRAFHAVMKCPPTLPNIRLVLKNSVDAIEAGIDFLPSLRPFIQPLLSSMEGTKLHLDNAARPVGKSSTVGLVGEYPAWSLLASYQFPVRKELVAAFGLHLAVSFLLTKPFQKGVVKDIRKLMKPREVHAITVNAEETEIRRLLRRAQEHAMNFLANRSSTHDLKSLTFNAGAIAHLTSDLSSLRTVERQAAGRDNELSDRELRAGLTQLLHRAQNDDGDALAICLAFCIGLPWDLSLQIPFLNGANQVESMVWIDPIEGWIYTNLSVVLRDLAKSNSAGHLPSTFIYRRPLPLSMANLLAECLRANYSVKRIIDLGSVPKGSRSKLNLADLHHSASISRLISSSGRAALKTSGRRDLAAFATLSLSLISKADLHYITPGEQSIWNTCDQLYQQVGLGPAIPTAHAEAWNIGSRVTPESAWISQVFEALAADVQSVKPGKKYKLESLVEHHNRYARYVGMLMQLAVGGRDRKQIRFLACAWRNDSKFGLVQDKPVGPTAGFTPIPIPATLSIQLRLWRAHLHALQRRLHKLFGEERHASKTIQLILNNGEVPLLFTLTPDVSAETLTSSFLFVGHAADLKRDFGRHFLCNHPALSGLPFEDIQDWLRHHTEGVSKHATTSASITFDQIHRVAGAIDSALESLNIRALPGLTSEGV